MVTADKPSVFGRGRESAAPSASPLALARPLPPPPMTAPVVPAPAPTADGPAVQQHRSPGVSPVSIELDRYLNYLVQCDGSDLHLSAGSPPKVRVNGDLRPIPHQPDLDDRTLRDALYAVMPERNRAEFEEHHDTDLAYENATARYRVNVFQHGGRIGAAMRVIPFHIRTAEDLGLTPAITTLASLPRGLVLVTGPTGSGKSTTLAALIDLANRTRYGHIITIEDPIEFTHRSQRATVTQRQVGDDTDSFAAALKRALRQDPDVILVGEMRDLETTSIALTAAETGHLVFATLHTSSARETVDRIIDQYPAGQQPQVRSQLANSLQGIVAQVLLKTLGGNGRVAAREILLFDSAVRNQVRTNDLAQLTTVMQSKVEMGMQTLNRDLARLVNDGTVLYEEAQQAASDLSELARLTRHPDPNDRSR